MLLHRPGESLAYLVPHPVLVASLVGLLITALNLIPAGQLDGGHILYALSPRVHLHSTRIAVLVLAAMGVMFWGGWLLWAVLLLMPAMRHPRVPSKTAVTPGQYALVPVCALLLVLSLTPKPFEGDSLLDLLRHDGPAARSR